MLRRVVDDVGGKSADIIGGFSASHFSLQTWDAVRLPKKVCSIIFNVLKKLRTLFGAV